MIYIFISLEQQNSNFNYSSTIRQELKILIKSTDSKK